MVKSESKVGQVWRYLCNGGESEVSIKDQEYTLSAVQKENSEEMSLCFVMYKQNDLKDGSSYEEKVFMRCDMSFNFFNHICEQLSDEKYITIISALSLQKLKKRGKKNEMYNSGMPTF